MTDLVLKGVETRRPVRNFPTTAQPFCLPTRDPGVQFKVGGLSQRSPSSCVFNRCDTPLAAAITRPADPINIGTASRRASVSKRGVSFASTSADDCPPMAPELTKS